MVKSKINETIRMTRTSSMVVAKQILNPLQEDLTPAMFTDSWNSKMKSKKIALFQNIKGMLMINKTCGQNRNLL